LQSVPLGHLGTRPAKTRMVAHDPSRVNAVYEARP
jgi:hypothetical protein